MTTNVRFCLFLLLLLPTIAYSSHGAPLPSVPADTLLSHLILKFAIGMYVFSIILNSVSILKSRISFSTFGWLIGCVAVAIHAGGFLLRWKETYDLGWGHFPLFQFYELVIMFCLMLAVTGLFLQKKSRHGTVSVFFLMIVVTVLILAEKVLFTGIQALYDPAYTYDIELIKFAHRLLVFKNSFMIICYCLLTTAGIVSLIAVTSKFITRKSFTAPLFPSEPILYEWNKKSILVGLITIWISLAIEMYWSNIAWGAYWSWDPKETALVLILIVYSLIALRNRKNGWNTHSATNKSIAGLLIIIGVHCLTEFMLRGI